MPCSNQSPTSGSDPLAHERRDGVADRPLLVVEQRVDREEVERVERGLLLGHGHAGRLPLPRARRDRPGAHAAARRLGRGRGGRDDAAREGGGRGRRRDARRRGLRRRARPSVEHRLPRPRGIVFADQEGGARATFAGIPPSRAASAYRSAAEARAAGRSTAAGAPPRGRARGLRARARPPGRAARLAPLLPAGVRRRLCARSRPRRLRQALSRARLRLPARPTRRACTAPCARRTWLRSAPRSARACRA